MSAYIEQARVFRVVGARAIVDTASGRRMPVTFDGWPAEGGEVLVNTQERHIVDTTESAE